MSGPARRSGIGRRVLAAFVLLAVGVAATMIVTGLAGYQRLGRHLLESGARPMMRLLMEAEDRAFRARDFGRRELYWGEELAGSLGFDFYVGKQVPDPWRNLADGLHLLEGDRRFVLLETRDGLRYALSGGTGSFRSLRAETLRLLLVCGGAGLLAAVLLGLMLSRRLTRPLVDLAHAVERGTEGALPTLPQVERHDEVGVLARAIAAREHELLLFARRESLFTGDVSHELRTPLTVLQGGLEVLELRLASLEGGESLTPVVARMQRTVLAMADMVQTLLLLARRPEHITMNRRNFSALVAELCDGSAAVTVSCPPDVEALGDEGLIRVVLRNLLDNARKYAEDGKVRVEVTPGRFTIRNRGLLPQDMDAFARGVRAPARPDGTTPPGSGLGLSLVQRACEQMGWIVRHEADEDGQTVFTVLFPPWENDDGGRPRP